MKMNEIVCTIKPLKDIVFFPPENISLTQYNRMTEAVADKIGIGLYAIRIETEYYTPEFYYHSKYRNPGIASYLCEEISCLKINYGYVTKYRTPDNKIVGYGICYLSEIITTNNLWYGLVIT